MATMAKNTHTQSYERSCYRFIAHNNANECNEVTTNDTNSINYYFCVANFHTADGQSRQSALMDSRTHSCSASHLFALVLALSVRVARVYISCMRYATLICSRKYGVKSPREFNSLNTKWYFIHLTVYFVGARVWIWHSNENGQRHGAGHISSICRCC